MSALGQVWARLQLLFAQGKATVVGADKVQVLVLDEEPLDNVARVEPYGFSYRPLGGEAYIAFPSGDRSFGIALLIGDKRYRMDLAAGEVALHDHQGNHVHIQADGTIQVKATTKVVADCPVFEATGNVLVAGNLVVKGTAQAGGFYGPDGAAAELAGGARVVGVFSVNGKDVDDGHTHVSGEPGAPTSEVV